MPSGKICKTIHQHNKTPVSPEDMKKLLEIAEGCRQVKNYVYGRFGGIASLSKLYPGYTVQNEMTKSGLREQLGLPSVYFYLAVFDALGDIKCQWAGVKDKVLKLIGRNQGLSPEEKHYLRFVIKINHAFDAVLNQKEMELPRELKPGYDKLAGQADAEKLHRYLRRQVRKYHVRQHIDTANGFSLSERAYRYEDGGIYIATKEKRRRIFIALTDKNQYKRQIYVKLYPEQGNIEIKVPVDVEVKRHEDYVNPVGAAFGYYTMLTTHEGRRYGEELGNYQTEYADWVRRQTKVYSRNRDSNPGREKYTAKKRRLTQQLHSYINHELNRFLQVEKPKAVYVAKLPRPEAGGVNRRINHSITMWQRGYIRQRLEQKCMEQSVEFVQVWAKDISRECSQCGGAGEKREGRFCCHACGWVEDEKTNTAKNALKRGAEGNKP